MNQLARVWFLIPFLLGFGAFGMVARDRFRSEATAQAKLRKLAQPPRRAGGGSRRIQPVTLKGPGGVTVKIPGSEPMIVNVWLQRCPDCMPRFNAARELARSGRSWPSPIVNVAYGSADLNWARRYGVGDQVVIDRGAAIVNPLGIRKFTTLVVDTDGKILLTDFVDRPGFLGRLEAAMTKARQAAASSSTPTSSPTPQATPKPLPLPTPQEPILSNRWAQVGLGLVLLGLAGGVLSMVSSDRQGGPGAPGPIQDWQEDLVASGTRCASCAGRFDEPEEASRCSACQAPYHRACARRERTCATQDCSRRIS